MEKKDKKLVSPEMDEDIVDKQLTASGLISDKPCWLYSFILTEGTSNYGKFEFRNGAVSGAKIKFTALSLKAVSLPVVFVKPIRFNKGLYLTFTTAGDTAFAQYKPDY